MVCKDQDEIWKGLKDCKNQDEICEGLKDSPEEEKEKVKSKEYFSHCALAFAKKVIIIYFEA